MALLNSLFSGVSGLQNHQIMMDTIGNNIANVNSIGYKSSRVTFSDTFNQFVRFGSDPSNGGGGSNTFQIGLGMKVNSIDRDWSQGTFERTGVTTDLALQGNSLFVLNSNGQQLYSRAGTFAFDSGGNLVNTQSGAIVQGRMATSKGVIPPGNNLEDIVVDTNLKLPAVATEHVSWGGNLDSTSTKTASDEVVLSGNIDSSSLTDGDTFVTNSVVYNTYGDAYKMETTLTYDDGVAAGTDPSFAVSYRILTNDGNNTQVVAPVNVGTIEFAGGTIEPSTTPGTLTDIADLENINVNPTVTPSLDLNFDLNISSLTLNNQTETISAVTDNNREVNIVDGTVTIFDSLGISHTLTVRFARRAANANLWDYRVSVPASSGTITGDPHGTISFDSNGGNPTVTPNPPKFEFQPNGGASPQVITMDFGTKFDGITQTSANSVVSSLSQDGSDAAVLSDLSIDQYGNIKGVFSNGKTRLMAQILLAKFKNNGGLISVGDNMYQVSANAGDPVIGDPGETTGTTIQSGALEQSNVDLSEEFTRMIVAQRGFQANARVVTTSDTLLQEITNIVR